MKIVSDMILVVEYKGGIYYFKSNKETGHMKGPDAKTAIELSARIDAFALGGGYHPFGAASVAKDALESMGAKILVYEPTEADYSDDPPGVVY